MDALLGKEVDYTIEGAETIKKAPESTGTSYNIEAQANQEIKFAYCTQFLIMLDTPISTSRREAASSPRPSPRMVFTTGRKGLVLME